MQSGTSFTEPLDSSADTGNLLGYALFNDSQTGTDILDDIGSGDGAIGFEGALASGEYTFALQQLGTSSDYTLAFEVESVEPPMPEGLQVSLFTGPDYLIEDEGTVSAHAFLATNGVIPDGGLLVSVDAPNLSEFDLDSVSVEGGEIAAVRDGGFDLLMTEYTTLVNLAVADDSETEEDETATFSLAAGEGYEITEDYSSGAFELIDTRLDIPRGATAEPNNTIPTALDTQITPENPTFSGSDSIYFDIGNRYLNEDGTYQYIDYSEDVNIYKVELKTGNTIAIETFEVEGNPNAYGFGLDTTLMVFDAEGNRARDFSTGGNIAAPDKLFGGIDPFDENETDTYNEFTAEEDGTYYIAIGAFSNVTGFPAFQNSIPVYDPLVPGSGNGDSVFFGNYDIEIDLLTEDNPRQTGTPTPPVGNPGVTEPPTLSLTASSTTTDSEGNFTNAVVEYVEPGGLSNTTFTIQAEGDIPEEGIEFVLNSNGNLLDYVSIFQSNSLPSTIGGQSLGAFYNEDGIPTGIRLRIEEPTMSVILETANHRTWFPDYYGNIIDEFEPLETDGAEDVTFFLQSGEGFEVAPDAGTAEVTYYDSAADAPPPTGGGDIVPEVGVTASVTELIETEETETTLTFTLSEAPPPEGVRVFLDSGIDPLVGSALSQFDVLEAEIVGGNFPVPDGDASGFFFTITEQTASITLSVFNELAADTGFAPDAFIEGVLALDFALQPQPGYTIDPNASEVNITILDNPESQVQVSLTGSVQDDEESTTLIEAEGDVSIHTFSLGAPPPEGGLTVSVSADSLGDFDLDAIEVAGGTIANLSDDGFGITITEQEATISLPVLEDGVDEGSETATFTLQPGEGYELNPAATAATFILADTLDQVDQVDLPEESEDNDTIPEANVLGLTVDSLSVSLSGQLGSGFSDPSEDVNLYSFNLEAGQTVSLDIDAGEWNTLDILGYPAVFPALDDVQLSDHELRLFDADGNEVAANNDGAALDEEFSRDPFIEYTAQTAGTYYVGVSALGNRDYDPFVERSGSGWTFPEVGVFFGPYDLTATLTDTPPEETTFNFDWIGQIAGFTLQGNFSYDPTLTYTDGIVREEDLTDFDVSFFDPDGTLLRTYEDNHLTFDDFNFAFDTNTQEILQDGFFFGPEGINIGEKTPDGDGFSGLQFFGRPELNPFGEVPPPHVHFRDWADEFGYPSGYRAHEDVAFFTRTTQDLLDTGGVGEVYVGNTQAGLDELGQRVQVFAADTLRIDQMGTDEAETLVGSDRIDGIDGIGGDDTIAGGLGDDIILGGDGDDILRGDLNKRSPQNNLMGGDDIIFGGEGADRIGGKSGNDILSGDAGDDLIYGDAGDDILMGVTGNDTLIGDNFSGGTGSDLFVFGNGDGTDTILDFQVNIDRIGLVEGELTFAELTVTQDGSNTLLGVASTGETLAILNGVQASSLTESSFEIVADVSNPEEALALI